MITGKRALPAGGALPILWKVESCKSRGSRPSPWRCTGLSGPTSESNHWPQKSGIASKNRYAETDQARIGRNLRRRAPEPHSADGRGAIVLLRSVAVSVPHLFIGHRCVLARSQTFRTGAEYDGPVLAFRQHGAGQQSFV